MSNGALVNWLKRVWRRFAEPARLETEINGMPLNARSLPPLRYMRWLPDQPRAQRGPL